MQEEKVPGQNMLSRLKVTKQLVKGGLIHSRHMKPCTQNSASIKAKLLQQA